MSLVVQSAKLHGHDPWQYLKDVLERLQGHPNNRIDELLPHLWTPSQQICQYGTAGRLLWAGLAEVKLHAVGQAHMHSHHHCLLCQGQRRRGLNL